MADGTSKTLAAGQFKLVVPTKNDSVAIINYQAAGIDSRAGEIGTLIGIDEGGTGAQDGIVKWGEEIVIVPLGSLGKYQAL